MGNDGNALTLRNVSKGYGDFQLESVSFELPAGYVMGLIGPNGAGKTTLIKLIMNLIRKENGSIHIFGLDNISHEVEAKTRIGFVYDVPAMYEHLSLKDMKRVISPFYPTWDDTEFKRLLDLFGLPAKKTLKKYSHGMLMKASLAIALSHHAELIIMDEPTSGLDPVFRRELLELLRDLMLDERRSILFSTHITSDLEKIADYITFIQDGRLVFSSTKDEVFDLYVVVKGGLDDLDEETTSILIGSKVNDFGFEGLTRKKEIERLSRRKGLLFERANLEDIMFFSKEEVGNASPR